MKLINAIRDNDLELAKKLIKEGYTLNEKDNRDWTALSIASWWQRKEIVKELIKAGASLTEKNIFDCTALDYSEEIWQSFDIQDIILEMYPDKYKLLEEKFGIHKDILLKLKMKQILDI